MQSRIDQILFQESWTEEESRTLLDACREDVGLAEVVSQWSAVRTHLRKSIEQSMPEPEALVLFALSRTEYDRTDEDVEKLRSLEAEMSLALKRHPSVELILDRIRVDAGHFDRAWMEAETSAEPVVRGVDRAPRRLPVVSTRLLRIGLSLAAVLAITLISIVLFRSDNEAIRTAAGEMQTVTLADGSIVRLMENSTLSFSTASEPFDRNVRLTGSAFFDVSENVAEFSVETDNAVTRVLGTRFGVLAQSALTEVTLVSGSVSLESVQHPGAPVILEPGQASQVTGNVTPSEPEFVIVTDALAWTRLFIFRDTSLPDIAERLSRSFNVTITIDPELEKEMLTGTFRAEQGVEKILQVITEALGIILEADTGSNTYRLHS